MIRDTLRRLARKLQPAPPPAAAPPPPPPPVEDDEEEEGPNVEIEAAQIQARIADGAAPLFLDIREVHELSQGYVGGATLIPMNDVPDRLSVLPKDRLLIVYCAAGVRSYGVAHYLREQGFDAWSLSGGIGAWLETGAPYHQPPYPPGRFSLTWPVQLKPAAAAQRGLPEDQRRGVIQAIAGTAAAPLYTVGIAQPGGYRLVEGVTEDELEVVRR